MGSDGARARSLFFKLNEQQINSPIVKKEEE